MAHPLQKTRRHRAGEQYALRQGATRQLKPEELLEAIRAVLLKTHGKTPARALLCRLCIEAGVLTRAQIAPNTFSRLVRRFELLKADRDCEGRHRLAFAKAHANELWQADTLYGPYVTHTGTKVQTRLIAFLDDASRVCCHGEFFIQENGDIEAVIRLVPEGIVDVGVKLPSRHIRLSVGIAVRAAL